MMDVEANQFPCNQIIRLANIDNAESPVSANDAGEF